MLSQCSSSRVQQLADRILAHFWKAKKKPNFTAVSLHGVPAGSGKKGGAASRKRRKLEISFNITKCVECLESSPSSSSALVSGSTTGSASPTQVCGASTLNISLDSQAGSSGSFTPVTGLLPFMIGDTNSTFLLLLCLMHILCRLFNVTRTCLLKLLQCLHLQPYPRVLLWLVTTHHSTCILLQETFQSVLGVATSMSSQLCRLMTCVFSTGSGNPWQQECNSPSLHQHIITWILHALGGTGRSPRRKFQSHLRYHQSWILFTGNIFSVMDSLHTVECSSPCFP